LVFLNLALDKHFAGDVDLLLERATIRRRLGDIPAALGDARQALSASADSRTNLMMGILIFLQGRIPKPDDARTREALEFLEKAVELSPGDYRPLFWRGVCLRDLGGSELERAFEDLRTAYRLHSASPFLALQLAGTRVDLMFRDSSSKNWKDAVDEAANAILGADSLSDEDLVAGFYELRRLSRSQAIKLHSKEAHLSRAKAFNQGREFDRSVEECSAAIEIDSGYRLGYLWRGYAYCSSRNHKEAQSDFRSAIKLSNDEERKAAEKWLNRCLSHSRN
jgi:tetratricopeptide (TPR) repeat protein